MSPKRNPKTTVLSLVNFDGMHDGNNNVHRLCCAAYESSRSANHASHWVLHQSIPKPCHPKLTLTYLSGAVVIVQILVMFSSWLSSFLYFFLNAHQDGCAPSHRDLSPITQGWNALRCEL